MKPYLAALKSEAAERILGTFGLEDKEKKRWPVSFEERLFRPGFKEWFAGLLNNEDREKIKMNISSF